MQSSNWVRQAPCATLLGLTLALAACSGGGSTTAAVENTGQTTNAAPIVSLPNLDQAAMVGEAFTYDASQAGTTFSDADGDALTYAVTLQPGNSGLQANGATITGTPTAALNVTARITATDPSAASVSDTFTIFISEQSDVVALSGRAGLRFRIGQAVNFDASDWASEFGNPSATPLSFTITLDTPVPGLVASGASLTGHPTSAGTYSATITASNGAGADASQSLILVIQRATTTGAPVLPATPFDYIAYAEADLPLHFRQPANGNNSIAGADNTPAGNPLTNAGATLGRVLFYDTRLSVNNSTACASCHVQAFAFAEPSRFSRGFDGQFTTFNAPQLTNVRFYQNGHMFWDERAGSIELQATVPVLSPVEMGNSLDNLIASLEGQAFYPPLFEAAFGDDAITQERIEAALAQFERAIVSYQSRFDTATVGNNPNANTPDYAGLLTPEELRGMALFQPVDAAVLAQAGLPAIQSLGCNQCHQSPAQILSVGPNGAVGPQNIGLDPDIPLPGASGIGDFKVPSLRNIALSAPYMHDGRFATLEEVITFYARNVNENGQTSRFLRQGNNANGAIQRFNVDDTDIAALAAFLRTLSDEELSTDPAFSDPFDQ